MKIAEKFSDSAQHLHEGKVGNTLQEIKRNRHYISATKNIFML